MKAVEVQARDLLCRALMGKGVTLADIDRLNAKLLPLDLRTVLVHIREDIAAFGSLAIKRLVRSGDPTCGPLAMALSNLMSGSVENMFDGGMNRDILILDPADPMPSARRFIEDNYIFEDWRTLCFYQGRFHAWNGSSYPPLEESAIAAKVYKYLDEVKAKGKDTGELVPFKPNKVRVGNVLDALRAVAHLPGTIVPPAWLGEEGPAPARELIACKNCLVNLRNGTTFPHSPRFFTPNSLPVEYLPEAGEAAEWHRFLDDLFDDDIELRDSLQEVFGYLLATDTRQQKIFLIVGPKRSGKGTIARVLTGLLGQQNICAPTLAGLGTNFGLSALLGKQVAIIADARLGGRADQHAIAERLLSISGEDGIDIDRKYLTPLTSVRLTTRFLILTNELPRIADASGALASRFIVLPLTQSFYGREDHGLTDRLISELPQILIWAIEGWRRLRERGRFLQPSVAREAIQELEDLGSPVTAFVRERCEIGGKCQVECQHLYDAWRKWCEENGRDHAGTIHTFGRDLRAVVPELSTSQHRAEHSRKRAFSGIRLLSEWEVSRAVTRA